MSTLIPSKFELDIRMFNEMYKLGPEPDRAAMVVRLNNFKKILLEELDEIDEVIGAFQNPGIDTLTAATELADLLGDLQVYCASEMARHGIPVQGTLDIIMASNFSKLDENGKPIYRESDGKVMKGPNYWKPEPQIRDMLLNNLG